MQGLGPGAVVLDRFAIDREVAAGGMGRVFRALDRATGEPIALKALLVHGSGETERFLREAALLEGIEHPGIVRHVAHGMAPSGEPFIAMEWLDGMDLSARLERGRLSVPEALGLTRRLAEALAAVHQRGLVHRDVKPSNVFLVGGSVDRIKLVDFGVARRAGDLRRLTRTGQILGTPCYMAPEQARGARDVDARADVFALGAVLFECLTGEPPFWGEQLIEVLAKVLLEPAPRLSDRDVADDSGLDALLGALLEKDRERRPADGSAVLALLDARAGAAKIEEARAAIGRVERRVLCMLLVGEPPRAEPDPLGSTQIAPDRSEFARRLDALARDAGARVEALVDGSKLIVMDGPGLAPDHAARAAALALAVRELDPILPLALATGRGEQSGSVPVGEVARRATALLARAGEGRIWLDDATAELVVQRFDVTGDPGARELATKRHELAGAAARPLLGRQTACVGRERELALLESLFEDAVADGEARAAMVLAPAGVGKSRLRRELCAQLSSRHPDLRLLFACGEVYAAGAPFGLIGQIVRRRAEVAAGAPPDAQRRALSLALETELAGEALERARTFLGEVAQIPAEEPESEALRAARRNPSLMGDGIRAAWHDFVAAECRRGPVLIVLDDVHWGDLPSLELVDSALRVLGRSRLVALALARPEVSEMFPGLWDAREPARVTLSTLGRRAAERLVRDVLGESTPDKTVRWIVERAAGNAFYLEELIRATAETGSDAPPAELPDTVLGLLQARLDALAPAHRRVLRAASVFGETFWQGGVDALLGGGAGLAESLDALTARELVEPSPTSRFPGERELAFRHALVRDAAYAAVTERDRQLAHESAGEWLERAGERDAAVLGEHFARGCRQERAGPFFLRAASEALEGNDLGAAVERAERGAALARDPDLVGALALVRAQALAARGDHARAECAALDAAAGLRAGDARWFEAMGEAVAAAARLGRVDAMLAGAQALVEREAEPGATTARVVSLCRTIVPVTNVLRLDVAARTIVTLDRIAPDLAELDAYAAAQLLEARGMVPTIGGDVQALALAMEEAIPRYEAAGALRDLAIAHGTQAWALILLGQTEAARRTLARGAEIAQRIGAPQPLVWVRFQLGVLDAEREPERAHALLSETIEAYRAHASVRQEGWAHTELARAWLALGDAPAAEAAAARGVELLESGPVFRPRAYAIHARTLLAVGDPGRALASAREAAALQKRHDFWLHDSVVRHALIAALLRAGETELGRAEIAAARSAIARRADGLARAEWREAFLALPEHAAVEVV